VIHLEFDVSVPTRGGVESRPDRPTPPLTPAAAPSGFAIQRPRARGRRPAPAPAAPPAHLAGSHSTLTIFQKVKNLPQLSSP